MEQISEVHARAYVWAAFSRNDAAKWFMYNNVPSKDSRYLGHGLIKLLIYDEI
jgi:hypothetical protein